MDAAAIGDPVTAVGFTVEARIAYEAAVEIITQNTYPERADHQPRFPEERALVLAHLLLTQVSVESAGELAPQVRGFNAQGGAAPIGPVHSVLCRPRNPLITAISLQQHQGRLTVGTELQFRIGTPAPCYPAEWNVRTTAATPANELPELPLSAIPGTLWSRAVTLGDPDLDHQYGIDTALGRAFAALALARFASTRSWRLLAVNLGLPARSATMGARHWHEIREAGLWPTYARAIAELFENLHTAPPPIDYQRRRITAQPGRAMAEARRAVTMHPELGLGRFRYARALWTSYTGSHASLAPRSIDGPIIEVLDPWTSALSESAARLGKPPAEPLTWHPP